jgi:hypothetical protein
LKTRRLRDITSRRTGRILLRCPPSGSWRTSAELARVMGTSIEMVERRYRTLVDAAGASIAGRLDALDAQREAGGNRR